MATIDFWFDYSCPYAYLGSSQIEALAARTQSQLRWQPMLLGGVFRAVGTPQNLSNVLSPAKARHNALDMARWAELFGVTLSMPAEHPFRTVEALRATLLSGIDPRVIHGFYRAYWIKNEPVSSQQTLRSVLTEAGHDASAILDKLEDPAIKDDLRLRTDRAIAIGVFGAPAIVVDEQELFWGQDRLHFVEQLIRQRAPSPLSPRISP